MSKKAETKKLVKVVEDRTFGLKNKNKSTQVQKFVKNVTVQVLNNGTNSTKRIEDEYQKKKRLQHEAEEKALEASLYKTVDTLKQHGGDSEEEDDRDPKSIVCAYFKQGLCQKGRKCKYSHDMSLEQKTELMDVYTDQREQLFNTNPAQDLDDPDSCANWDEKTLRDVVEVNAVKYKLQKPTEIVCKFFLDALEKGKYGWKWLCPNGMQCHYRHCLPQGYIYKKKTLLNDYNEEIGLEDMVDELREGLKSGGMKISKDMFLEWKAERAIRKEAEVARSEDPKKKGVMKQANGMTGRALFQFDPTLFVDDDEAAEDDIYAEREDDQDDDDDDGQKAQYSDDEDVKKKQVQLEKQEPKQEQKQEQKHNEEQKQEVKQEEKKQEVKQEVKQEQKEEKKQEKKQEQKQEQKQEKKQELVEEQKEQNNINEEKKKKKKKKKVQINEAVFQDDD